MEEKEELHVKRMVKKSIEAFIVGIELYNKPTINYRIEGFSFFICNAWELMLKAYLIKKQGEKSIFYKKDNSRTISLNDSIKKVFTNDKDPLRINLEKIIELRNTSTHFITEDYESIYAPLFQANVINFVNKMRAFHDEDITKYIANNFLTINLRVENLSDTDIRVKYTPAVAEKIILSRNAISTEYKLENSKSFAIPVKTNFYITKNPKNADLQVSINKDADAKVEVVKEIQDINTKYPFLNNQIIKIVNNKLKKQKILLTKIFKSGANKKEVKKRFTTKDFQLFDKFYNIKQNEKYSYHYKTLNRYAYSNQLVDFIFEEIKKDPEHIVQNLKNGIKK